MSRGGKYKPQTLPTHYQFYVGQYVKRFYAPFTEESIYKIVDYRKNKFGSPEFLYMKDNETHWADCEDSCIITDESPIKDIQWVANVNSDEYEGFNPFIQKWREDKLNKILK